MRASAVKKAGARLSVDALARARAEQVHHAVGVPAQPHRVGQPGRRARIAPRHQVDAGARMGVDVGLAAEVLDEVDDDLNSIHDRLCVPQP